MKWWGLIKTYYVQRCDLYRSNIIASEVKVDMMGWECGREQNTYRTVADKPSAEPRKKKEIGCNWSESWTVQRSNMIKK